MQQDANKVQRKSESLQKQNYELRKRDPGVNMSEVELANKSYKDAQALEDKTTGYGMLILPDQQYMITRPTCYIGRQCPSNLANSDESCFISLNNQNDNKSISRVAAKIFYSSKLGEFCIENIGKNSILVDRRSLKRSSGCSSVFLPLRNEA